MWVTSKVPAPASILNLGAACGTEARRKDGTPILEGALKPVDPQILLLPGDVCYAVFSEAPHTQEEVLCGGQGL
jgi:hypothetical protein